MRKLLLMLLCGVAAAQIKFGPGVEVNPGVRIVKAVASYQTPALAQPVAPSSSAPAYIQAQTAGNMNVVIISWNDASRSLVSVSDDAGNTYAVAAPTATYTSAGVSLRQAIYYAKNIAAHAAGNTVHVTWDGTPSAPRIYALEFSGLDQSDPLDVYASGSGTVAGATPVATGTAATGTPVELLVGAGLTTYQYQAAGANYNLAADLTSGSLVEYASTTATGTYVANATTDSHAQNWLLQLATFRAAGQTVVNLSPVLSSVLPNSGPVAGGTALTLDGSGFASGAKVLVGGAAASGVAVASTQITASTPAHFPGVVEVTVINPGAAPVTLPNRFAYVAAGPLGGFGVGGLGENGYGD